MTTTNFVTLIESFYGEYKPLQRKIVQQWANDRSPEYQMALSQVMFETYTARYGIPPGIPEFNDAADDVVARLEKKAQAEKAANLLAERYKLLSAPTTGAWDEVEYNGRVMTRASAYLQCLTEGIMQGIHPKKNAKAKALIGYA
jgi:hypothetical protein